jgi:CDP-diacylglycerol--glycerol-3-phosphate 3-phosphatidyltransferase
MFDGHLRSPIDRAIRPVGNTLRKLGLSADWFTILGVVLAVAAAIVIGSGGLRGGLLLVVLAALPDLLDGAVAKASGSASPRGAFFDSVIDRVTDGLLFGGVAWYLAGAEGGRVALLPMAVFGAASLISYERAKAESLGFAAKGGLMERAERIILLCLGLLFDSLLVPILWVMLVLTLVTAVQRFVKVWRQASAVPPVPAQIAARRQRRVARQRARAARRSPLSTFRRSQRP